MKTKYDTENYYDVLDNYECRKLHRKVKKFGWKSLSLKEFSNIKVHSSDIRKFMGIRSNFVPRLLKTESECLFALERWSTIFRKTHLIESFKGKVFLLESVQRGYALGFNRSMIIRLADEVLGKIKNFKQYKKWVEGITGNFANEGNLSEEYGFKKDLNIMYLKLIKRVFKNPDGIFDHFTSDRLLQNEFFTGGPLHHHFIDFLLPFFITENSDNFRTWYRLYSWDFSLKQHKEQALKRMAYWAKSEEDFKKLIDIAPSDSLIQRHALAGLNSIRGVISQVA
jgi:hypothetical protein